MVIQNVNFSVSGHEIKYSTITKIVANSVNLVTATFSFSQEWSSFTKKAIFTNGEISKTKVLTQNTVEVPSECLVAGTLHISVVGVIEEPYTRITTEHMDGIPMVVSGALHGDAANIPTPTEGEQILLIANGADAKATQALETANSANKKSNAAVSTVNTANANASEALATANGIDAKASTALSQSSSAVSTANTASATANGIDAKATAALSQSSTAVGTANSVSSHVNSFKGLRLAKRVIVPDGTTRPSIEIDTDSDGNPLNSVLGGELLCYSGENASMSAAMGYLQINGITTSEYWGTVLEPTEAFAFGLWGNVSTEVFSKIRLLNKNVTINVKSTARYEYGGGMKRHGGGMTTPQTAVTAIKLFLASGTFPAGTIVEWWERG